MIDERIEKLEQALSRAGLYIRDHVSTPDPYLLKQIDMALTNLPREHLDEDERIAKEMGESANHSVQIIIGHEAREHGGERCERERANFVAFLIHKLGLFYQDGFGLIIDRAKEYEESHDQKAH